MYGHILLSIDRSLIVDRLADYIEHSAEGSLADGHFYRCAGIDRGAAAGKTVGGEKRYASYAVIAYMLDRLHDDLAVRELYLDRIVYIRHFTGGKLDIYDRPYDPSDNSVLH